MYRVFVYGTLKRGQPNHYVLENIKHGKATFVGEAITEQKYPLIIASRSNLPFLLNVQGTGEKIIGEIYEVDENMMTYLDHFEDYPNLYDRLTIKVLLNNALVECACYVLSKYKAKLLELPYLSNYDAYGAHGKQYLKEVDESCDDYDDVLENKSLT